MGMVVRTNTMAINAYRQLGMNNSAVSKSLEKLASGYRINRAGDDAAGLAISEKMKAQITGLETASANAQDGISLIQTAEGNLNEVHDMLNRMVELATKSANGTYTQTERDALQSEVDQLLDEIDRISQSANFNGAKLLDGTIGMNSEAFKLGEFGAVEGQKGADLTSKLGLPTDGTATATNTAYHLGTENITQVGPSFTIDLADLALGAGTGGDATVKVTVGTSELTSGNLGATAKSAKDIRDAILADKANWTGKGKVPGNAKIGDFEFKVEADGETGLKFTYAGMNANTTPAATDEFTSAQADTLNNTLLGSTVAVNITDSTGGSHQGAQMHDTQNVEKAVAKVQGARAGMDIGLTADVVKLGQSLTIDGKTFTFVSWDGSSELGENEIGIKSSYDLDKAADQTKAIHDAVDQLSHKETDNFVIEVKDGTTIHIDQKVGNTNVYDTDKKMKALVSAKGVSTGAGTELTVNSDKIAAGDKLKVGSKTYTFGDGANDIKIGDSTVADLKKALEKDGFTVDMDGDKLTISAAADQPTALIGGDGLTLQIGDTADSFNKMTVGVPNMGTLGLGLDGLVITNQVAASNAIDTIKNAINSVSTARADMGALQNRLEHTINNLDVAAENLSAANSRIRDTDMAKEMMNYTKMNVLVQSAQAMLAQANQQPQSVLQLLQ